MYQLFVQFHKEKNIPFLKDREIKFSNINESGENLFILINESNNRDSLINIIVDILVDYYKATFNPIDKSVFINNEKVFDCNQDECIFDGILFYIGKQITSSKWTKLSSSVDTNNVIEFQDFEDNFNLKVDGKIMLPLSVYSYSKYDIVGRKVFWLDPCAFNGREHSSDWKTISAVKFDIIVFDDDTECYLEECFI